MITCSKIGSSIKLSSCATSSGVAPAVPLARAMMQESSSSGMAIMAAVRTSSM